MRLQVNFRYNEGSDLDKWLELQSNKSVSVKLAIRYFIRRVGMKDVSSDDFDVNQLTTPVMTGWPGGYPLLNAGPETWSGEAMSAEGQPEARAKPDKKKGKAARKPARKTEAGETAGETKAKRAEATEAKTAESAAEPVEESESRTKETGCPRPSAEPSTAFDTASLKPSGSEEEAEAFSRILKQRK